ncbi:MAG: Macrolide export protein MacA [Pseudomonas citronellolis]|nr:MAG: Macrolide export protein MacA [Pseudomonas citronellolis]
MSVPITRARVVLGLALAALCAAGLAWSLSRDAEPYRTQPVARGDLESLVSAIGTLKPRIQVEVGARASGQIDRLYVKVGDSVAKGQLLAEIDPRILQATVDADRAQLAELQAQLAEQQAQYQLAERQLARQKRMYGEGSTRLEDLQVAESNWQVAQAKIHQLQARLQQTRSTLSADQTQLGYTRLYAPIAGTVVALDAEEGQTLNATYQTPTLLKIADLSSMTVWTDVSEADVGRVKAGMPVRFVTLGGEGRTWHGVVRQVLPAPQEPRRDEGSSSSSSAASDSSKVVQYTVLFDIDNPDGELMSRMTAQVSFVAANAKAALKAPLVALQATERAGEYRARVWKGGRVEMRDVRLGVRNRIEGEVLAGLDEGDALILGEREADDRPARLQW